jgi:hypothetical protein
MWKENSRLIEDNEQLSQSEKVNRNIAKLFLVHDYCQKNRLDANKLVPKMKINTNEAMHQIAQLSKSVENEIKTALQSDRGQDRNRGQDQSRGR